RSTTADRWCRTTFRRSWVTLAWDAADWDIASALCAPCCAPPTKKLVDGRKDLSPVKLQRDLLGLAVLFLLSSLPAFAQTTGGGQGTITEESGAAVAGVTVTITNVETSLQRETVSDDSGFYQLLALQPGAYTLAAKKTGFRQATSEGLRLE